MKNQTMKPKPHICVGQCPKCGKLITADAFRVVISGNPPEETPQIPLGMRKTK